MGNLAKRLEYNQQRAAQRTATAPRPAEKIVEGLKEALAVVKGEVEPYKVHKPKGSVKRSAATSKEGRKQIQAPAVKEASSTEVAADRRKRSRSVSIKTSSIISSPAAKAGNPGSMPRCARAPVFQTERVYTKPAPPSLHHAVTQHFCIYRHP